MSRPSQLLLVVACLAFSTPAWGQSTAWPSAVAYVSAPAVSTTPGQISSVTVPGGATTLLVSTPGADYEGLVVGPNPAVASTSSGGTTTVTHPVLVYACNRTGGEVVRFDPAATPIPPAKTIQPEVIYSGGAGLQQPQCGRITSTGDLIVTDTGTGSGWWIFRGIASQALTGNATNLQTPFQLTAQSGTLEGTALRNSGDLLVVDHKGNQIFQSFAAAGFGIGGESTFITSKEGLVSPFGIARKSDGQIYVSNQQANKPFIAHFKDDGTASCSDVTIKHTNTLAALQMSPGDTLYAVGSTTNGGGALFSLDATASNGCLGAQATISSSFPEPLVGVALALPSFTSVLQTLSTSGGTGIVSFGYAAFQVSEATGACSLPLHARPTPPAFLVSGPIAGVVSQATPLPPNTLAPGSVGAVDNGWDGFETVVQSTRTITNTDPCLAIDGDFHFLLATQVPLSLGGPQVVSCADDFGFSSPPCEVDTQSVFPLISFLPADSGTGGTKLTKAKCQFFLTNSGAPTNNENGFFCGFQSPLTNTFDPKTGKYDLPAASVSSGALPVKFNLAINGMPCSGGSSFIDDALALLSLEQIADANGNPVQVPIQIAASGGSSPLEPIFNNDPQNGNYHFNLQLGECTLPSGQTGPCPSGTYAVTVAFLSANTASTTQTVSGVTFPQSIYTVQTTTFVIP